MNTDVRTQKLKERVEAARENPTIIAQFPVQGERLPADHGYLLYSAVSRLLPELHEARWLGVELISGVAWDRGVIVLPKRNAHLRLRLPANRFGSVLLLSGKRLEIGDYAIRIGIPLARPLQPASSLYARIVTIRPFTEIPEFLAAAERNLEMLGINARLEVPSDGRSRQRRIITIKDKRIVGFSLAAHGLSDEDSILLQSVGLGGRRAMGCGIFNPIRRPYDFEGGNHAV